jgi:hypothetical protein
VAWSVHGLAKDVGGPSLWTLPGGCPAVTRTQAGCRPAQLSGRCRDTTGMLPGNCAGIVRGHRQTVVAVADWLWARTDCGCVCGQDKAVASRRDNGADISRLIRDPFADIRTLKVQGVRRPLSNPHKIVWEIELA